jgi:type II secretory pathway pseudopilin PulG
MQAKYTAYILHGRGKQHGAILLIMLVILVISIAAILVSSLTTYSIKNARQATTAAALAQAREALIGYAVRDSNRPGEFPCPDSNNDGKITVTDDYVGSSCKTLIGRLPWITLGLPELFDGAGEHLWYALSDPFHANGSAILNSNTKGTLLVYGPDGATLQTKLGYSAVAVIFSAGSYVGSQTRTTAAEQNDPANYLDIANSIDNSSASGPFIAGTETLTFNDQLIYITTQDFIPLVEQRVAYELKKALNNYYTAHGYYPWADALPGPTYASNYGLNRGWLPDDTYVSGSTAAWGAASPPSWFVNNQWNTLIYYSVGRNYTQYASGCSSCDIGKTTLNVNGVWGTHALFFMPGTPIGTMTRVNDYTLTDYLEDSQNNDDSNDWYVTPASTSKDRDRLYTLP